MDLTNPHFSQSFYSDGGFGHVYCVAVLRASRRVVEYVYGAHGCALCTPPVSVDSLQNPVRNAG
jgi:hypothetical protein